MRQVVTTYSDLKKYCEAFAKGHFELFVLVGSAGLAKTTSLKKTMEDREAKWFEGSMSAFKLYCEAYENRGLPLVIDDVDSLYTDKAAVRVLKCLCQTEKVKVVGWHTAAKQLEKCEIPNEFFTDSKVCIIANVWDSINKNVAAVSDRGIVVDFQPTAHEVHEQVRGWKDFDQVVFRYIEKHLDLIHVPSMRIYVVCSALKKAGLDWKKSFLDSIQLEPEQQVLVRLLNEEFATEEERAKAWVSETGLSRPTYFRVKGKLPKSITEKSKA